MKLLLTSAGVQNPSIHAALVELLGKPIEESTALCIPTALYGHAMCGPDLACEFVGGTSSLPMCDLGWKSVGLLELTALSSIDRDRWMRWVDEADVFLVAGGDAAYLAHWMRESGLVDLFPTLTDKVWVGLSGGSMVMAPRIGADFVTWPDAGADDTTLGVVDFAMFPHLGMEPHNTMAHAERWAAQLGLASYAMDDATAIRVVDGAVDVISEGSWRQFA